MKPWFVFFALWSVFSVASQGQDYFQQDVSYRIKVKLDDGLHTLSAFEELSYTNNSTNTLDTLYFHLWPNAYKNNSTALGKQLLSNGSTKFYYADDEQRGYIDSLDFKIDGKKVNWSLDPVHIDICWIALNEPLKPTEQIKITTPFKVKIPVGKFSRLGHLDQAYQITQWYPKPAVYDKNGWNVMPYLNQGEFYSEYGSFDVQITLPKEYIVGSTGDYFESADEEEWMNYLSERDKSKTNNTKVSGDWKTIRFKQENVHDFAWFADKTWLVQKGEVELPHSKRKVTTWIMYQPDSKDTWEDAISYVNDAIYYYSLWNGDYPYNQMTAVDGALTAGGGMEYPNITVIGQTNNKFRLEQVIMHETGHQWFYGILGSNERIHPWMDEGINSFNESRYIETKYPDAHMLGLNDGKKILDKMDLKRPNRDTYYFSYLFSARNHRDQPMEFPAAEYTGTNYGTVVYMKSAVAFRHLKNYLGTEAFDSAMQEYFETWKFKHPSPKDLREVLEKSTGKDLSWFFEDMLLSTKPIDYKLKSVKEKEGSLSLSIKNKTGLVAPLCLSCVVSDTLALTKWEDGFTGSKTFQFSCPENTHKVRVNQFASLDINRGNNERRLNGLFKGVEPIKFQMAATIENGQKTQILYMPVAAWNNYNRWMLGAAFFNSRIPKQKFEYLFMPLYSFSTKDLNGIGKINYTFFSEDYNSLFHSIVIGANARRFANFNIDRTAFSYERYEPFINFVFNKPSERDINNHEIRLRNVIVNEDFGTKELNHYPELSYSLTRKHPLNPQSLKFRLQSAFLDDNSSFTRISIDAKQEIEYNKMGKLITVRAFAGKFITNETTHPRFNWRADGTMGAAFLGAYTDFNYDKLFLGRTETRGLLSQQFYEDQGGFKSFNPIGQSNDWIAALNLKIDLPIPLPLGFFTDFAVNSNNDFTYDFGVHCILLKDIIEVYVPLGYSKNLQEAIDLSGRSFGDQIRFVLNLPAMGPLQALDNLDF